MSEGMTDEQRRRFGEELLNLIRNTPPEPIEEQDDQTIADYRRLQKPGEKPRAYFVEDHAEAEDAIQRILEQEDA